MIKLSRNKKIFFKNGFIILFITIITLFFMSYGYALLETNLTTEGQTSIATYSTPNVCPGYLGFSKISNWNDTYIYQLFINNTSEEDYNEWELKIYNPGFISFPEWFEGETTADGWILKDDGRNRFIGKKSSISIILTFDVLDGQNKPKDEYAEYFVQNFIFFTGCGGSTANGKKITKGNTEITLGMYEEELTNYTLIENTDYTAQNEFEKQYILTINNDTKNDYLKIRGNIYLGSNKIIAIDGSTITEENATNVSFESLYGYNILHNTTEKIYITINKTEDITPEIIIVGLIDV